MTDPRRTHFDWAAIKRRLSPDETHAPEQEDLASVFRERAVALAKRPSRGTLTAGAQHLRFSVQDLRFAIAVADVKTCLAASWVTRIPCAPAHMADVIHVQGRLVSVLDLGVLFGAGAAIRSVGNQARVILVEALGRTVGVWAGQLDGIVTLDQAAFDTARTQGSRGAEFLRGITADMTLVLAATELVKRAKDGAFDASR
jgi:chemotaxis signal transduction protein